MLSGPNDESPANVEAAVSIFLSISYDLMRFTLSHWICIKLCTRGCSLTILLVFISYRKNGERRETSSRRK